jgi:hypothetical protein
VSGQRCETEVDGLKEEGKREIRIFLQIAALIAVLAGVNFYIFAKGGNTLSLIVGIICVAVLIGWCLFYSLYVRKRQ